MMIKLQLQAGLMRNGTNYQSLGRWFDANLMRFFEGQIRPMKGWATGLTGTLSGNPRAAHAWKDNTGAAFAAFGTHTGLYAHDGTTLDDITPDAAAATVTMLLEDGSTDLFAEDSTTLLLETGFNAGDADTSTWTLDNFGELLVACNDAENAIYEWQPGGGFDATAITNAPTAEAVFVTNERFIIALGSDGDPRRVAWNDQENRAVWAASSTNQAGDLNLQTAGVVMCGGKVRGGGLIWTDLDLHLMRYQGFPDIYGIERVGNDCGIIGRHAFMIVDSVAYWMGANGFWRYAGYAEPLPCEISDDVFSNLNTTYKNKVWCQHFPQFSEVWWFYPRVSNLANEDVEDLLTEGGQTILAEGGATECSHAAIFNYREGHWNHTALARNCGFAEGTFAYPLMVNSSGAMLYHEYGWSYDSNVRRVVSGPVELGDGERRLQIDEFIPDELAQGDCEVYFFTRETPNASEYELGPYNAADRVGVITTARQARIEIRAEDATQDFRIGNYRVNARQRGRY